MNLKKYPGQIHKYLATSLLDQNNSCAADIH